MKLIYMAHPFGGDPRNLERAKRWYLWLVREFPRNAYECSWLVSCELLDDSDPFVRRAALARDFEIVRKCDALLFVGGEITKGMRAEAQLACAVLDLSMIGPEPPEVGSHAWITEPMIGLAAGVLDGAQLEAERRAEHEPACPGPECIRCSGEYCDEHLHQPCACDAIDRHGGL